MAAALIVFFMGHRLSGSIGDIASAAAALGRGEPLPPYKPSIREIDDLRAALDETHSVLERETEGRTKAEVERLQLFESEQAARQLAEQQNRAKDEFLAMLGHELRNPLSAISGAVALMKAPTAQEEHRLHAREVISRQVQHLSRVVDDLLDLSRVMTGKIVLDFVPVDLAQAAANCLSAMRAAGRVGEHELKVDLHSAWVNGDATRIEQIIGNLLSNAFKYTPPEGRIELAVAAQSGEAVLTVRDTGLGIPKRLLPHVFDVFVQGDQSLERAKGGLGIGLALVQRLVVLHGGSVHAESAGDGRGSVFTVRLPLIAAPQVAEDSKTAMALGRQRLRVLVVDDHEDTRTKLRLLLEQTGHEAIEAVDGIDGVQLALSRRPDVAIVDIGLPGINGYEVARRLRQLPHSRPIALIALTGYGQDEDRRRALQVGFDRHIVKPVDAERLKLALIEVTRSQPASEQ
jgi:signal transduction histidine kinase/ActR/RegA family two-component response regulator